MKRLLLVLLLSSFAYGGAILPEIVRDQSVQNISPLGTAWTKKKSHIGYYGSYSSDIENQGDLTVSVYNEKVNVEVLGDDDGEVVDLYAKVGWKLEDAVAGVSFYHDGDVDNYTSTDLAYGMKHSGNIYSGFALRRSGFGDVNSTQFYGGIGYLNEFDETKKSAYEASLKVNSGEYNTTTNEELLDYKSVNVRLTEIINDYQFYGSFTYLLGESEKNSYEYDLISLYGEVERRLNQYWFISLLYKHTTRDREYDSGSKDSLEANTSLLRLRWVLNNTHQIKITASNSDATISGYSTKGSVFSVGYQYLWD